MSADIRVWAKWQWDDYFKHETEHLRSLFLFNRLSSMGFWQAHDSLGETYKQYIYSRMRLYKRGYVKQLEF